MKTIFLSVYDGDTEKNILQSGVLRELENSGHRVVLLIRSALKGDYDRYKKSNTIIERLPNANCFSERLYFWLGWNLIPTYSITMRRMDAYNNHKNYLRFKIEQFIGLLGRSKTIRSIFRFVYYYIPDDYAGDLFVKYKPDVLFAPNMFSYEDGRLLKNAKKRGIKTITTSKSWDVLTNKAFTRVRADKILVQNSIIKENAINIGDYEDSQIKEVGFIQFDTSTDQSLIVPREEFFKKIGADPNRKLILYSTSGDWKNPYDDEVVEAIHKAIEDGGFSEPVQIMARFHPKYPSKIEKLELKYLIKDRPCKSGDEKMKSLDGVMNEVFSFSFTEEDVVHLANSIYHSDVTVNTMSTMTLDAVSFDKPVVLINHDGLDRKLDYWNSIRRAYDEEHYTSIMDMGAAKMSDSVAETIKHINDYLVDPSLDKEKRELVRDKVLFNPEGKVAKRIAEEVLSLIRE